MTVFGNQTTWARVLQVYNFFRKQAFVGGLGLIFTAGSVAHLLAAIVFAAVCLVIQARAEPYGDYKQSGSKRRSNNTLALCADLSLLFFLGSLFVLKLKVNLSDPWGLTTRPIAPTKACLRMQFRASHQ